jgi:hypothetical protein
MRDAPEPTASNPALALYVGNMCRVPGPAGAGLFSRPGFGAMGTGATALGAGSVRACQALLTWTNASGVRQTTAIVGGKIYGYTWSTETWAEVVTAANLATATITLSATTRVALVPFADGLVVSDGTNTPFWWDGTTGASGLTEMTNAPAFYGPPTVYYSKLMGIKASNRNTLVWSEEGAPNLGYEAGGYNNAWDNPGGYSDPLTSVIGTNEALYVFRERNAIAITGAVSTDFATAGTRSNLSEDVGTLSPWATYAISQGILVVDADAQPWLMKLGMLEPMPLWADCRQTVRGTPRASLINIQTVQDDATYSLVIGYPELGATDPTAWLCFSQDDLAFVGVWSWPESAQRAGMVIDGDGVARWAHAGVDDGRLYVHGDLESGPWNDVLASGTEYIAQAVVTAPLGYDLDRELVIDQFEAAITGTGVTQIAVSYETPRGQSVPMNVPLSSSATGLSWDVGDWDEENWSNSTRDQKVRVGLRGRGRWARMAIRHSEDNEPFGVTVVRVRAYAHDGNPRSP